MPPSADVLSPPKPAARRRGGGSWWLWGVAALVGVGVLLPLAYLLVRAASAEPAELAALVLRARTARLLGNTLLLTFGVLVVTTGLALPLAWLAVRADLGGRRLVTLLGVLPLAVPGYVMAYALLGATGNLGLLAELGLAVPRIGGYDGALLALSLTTFPYLFLNLRAALLGLDPSLVEAARALGASRTEAFRRVVLPQLRPALGAGGLLVALHVVGDFGVVSLMRYETFSYALYVQYTAAFDRTYAAWLALMLLALAVTVLLLEARLLRGLRLDRAGGGARRHRAARVRLGRWRAPAWTFVGTLLTLGLVLPLATTLFWLLRDPDAVRWAEVGTAAWASVRASAPAAGVAALVALPLAWLGVRRAGLWSRLAERIAYLGYATPPLAFALALIFFSLRAVPSLYQTLALLVAAYVLHFLAEAVGPVRSALYQAPPRLEEAARALGRSPLGAFVSVTLPLVRRGLVASAALVFLSAMKELPLTILLAPTGFETLAMGAWSYAGEAVFAQAAPFALAAVFCSAGATALLLARAE